MPTDGVTVTFTLEFKRNLRALAKKYRSIRSDLQPLIDQLLQGHLPGEQVPGTKFTLFKVRLNNSDAQKGKRGGYRCIYYLKTHDHVTLITIYSKSERADVSLQRLQSIIGEFLD